MASVASKMSGTVSASDNDKPSPPPSSENAVWKADPKSCHKLGSRLPPAEASELGLLSSATGDDGADHSSSSRTLLVA